VGVVVDVSRDVSGAGLNVTVKPAVDFQKLEEVYVLR
jgi:cell shape-determining protein MreC